MNCYNFEANISAYIDGELNQSDWKGFTEHHQNCVACKSKLEGVRELLGAMKAVPEVTTSDNFFKGLQRKIEIHENKSSFITRIIEFKPFGMNPLQALGFAAVVTFMVISSFMLFNTDKLPVVNFDELSRENQLNVPAGLPNQSAYPRQNPALAAHDHNPADSTKDKDHGNPPNYDNQMQLVNQQGRP
ncbi:MAG: zf-HC2 domain-containing protein [FCB group bacterium]|nr:zf-HC2 domain-containing protein [FCB group bacterium]